MRLSQAEHQAVIFKVAFLMGIFLVCLLIMDPSWSVTVEALRAPIQQLKSEIFGGWMIVVKIAAVAVGIVLSAFKGSLAPFGIGAGLSLGIHLYDAYLGTGITGALI